MSLENFQEERLKLMDEIFDLFDSENIGYVEIKDSLKILAAIGKKLDIEEELTVREFEDVESFLKDQLNKKENLQKVNYLLAYLYTHRLMSDSKKISKYGREAIRLEPGKKENTQWMINKAEAGYCWDWDISNHNGIIKFCFVDSGYAPH